MTRRIKSSLEPIIIKRYGVYSTLIFAVATFIVALDYTVQELFSPMFKAELERVGVVLFAVVLCSSIVGMLFHHWVSMKHRERNAFAFVFSFTSLKFLTAAILFQALPG